MVFLTPIFLLAYRLLLGNTNRTTKKPCEKILIFAEVRPHLLDPQADFT